MPAFDHASALGKNVFDFPQFQQPRECDYGYFPVLKRHCLQAIGFVDSRYQHYYVDPDIGYALQKLGLKNVYVPTAVFMHHQKSVDEIGTKGVQQKAVPDLLHYFQKWDLVQVER